MGGGRKAPVTEQQLNGAHVGTGLQHECLTMSADPVYRAALALRYAKPKPRVPRQSSSSEWRAPEGPDPALRVRDARDRGRRTSRQPAWRCANGPCCRVSLRCVRERRGSSVRRYPRSAADTVACPIVARRTSPAAGSYRHRHRKCERLRAFPGKMFAQERGKVLGKLGHAVSPRCNVSPAAEICAINSCVAWRYQ